MRIVILDNLRSAWNVGSIFRTAAALNYDHVALCGVTITPPAKKLSETSRGMEEQVAWSSFLTTMEGIQHFKDKGYRIVAIEKHVDAINIKKMKACEKVAFVLGNEALGIAESILNQCHEMVELPMYNEQQSINVSCAFSAVAYRDLFLNE